MELDTVHFSFITVKFDFAFMTCLYFKIDLRTLVNILILYLVNILILVIYCKITRMLIIAIVTITTLANSMIKLELIHSFKLF